MKRFLCVLIIMTSTLSFIGCGEKKDDDTSDANSTSIANESENDTTDDLDNEELSVDINPETTDFDDDVAVSNVTDDSSNDSELNDTSTDTSDSSSDSSNDSNTSGSTTDSENSSDEKGTSEADTTERTFKISTIDSSGESDQIVYSDDLITIGVGVADNLRFILGTVSAKYFDQNPIELQTIETIGEKKIAVINLSGDENYWLQKFAGSAQALSTEHTLIENVLQREYSGYWIDGVRFTLNESAIEDSGHIPSLSTTSYRMN